MWAGSRRSGCGALSPGARGCGCACMPDGAAPTKSGCAAAMTPRSGLKSSCVAPGGAALLGPDCAAPARRGNCTALGARGSFAASSVPDNDAALTCASAATVLLWACPAEARSGSMLNSTSISISRELAQRRMSGACRQASKAHGTGPGLLAGCSPHRASIVACDFLPEVANPWLCMQQRAPWVHGGTSAWRSAMQRQGPTLPAQLAVMVRHVIAGELTVIMWIAGGEGTRARSGDDGWRSQGSCFLAAVESRTTHRFCQNCTGCGEAKRVSEQRYEHMVRTVLRRTGAPAARVRSPTP